MLNLIRKINFNYSEINDYLLIGTTPSPDDYKLLKKLGVKLVINMRAERKASSSLIPTLWVPWLDIKFIQINPSLLLRAVHTSQHVISKKGKIYVYCRVGRHRSVVMGAAILIAQGYNANKAIQLIKKYRPQADPYSKYINKSILNFERKWSSRNHLP